MIASGSDKVFVADVALLPAFFVRNPGWWPMFDFDPEMAVQARRKVYDRLVAEKILLRGFHYPFPSLAHIEKSGMGYRETTAVESDDLNVCVEAAVHNGADIDQVRAGDQR